MNQCFKNGLLVSMLLLLFAATLTACGSSSSNSSQVTVNVAYFPNLTHAVAIVGVARGTLKQDLGSHVNLQTRIFTAGPSEIEALYASQVDIGFVGPSPAINGYVNSHGSALRIIAGASSGGVSFIVRPGVHITTAADLANKKIADPQLGGTQDVALRYYLKQNGLQAADKGGNVQIVPTAPATILTLFKQGSIDGAWVPEPWGTRLIVEGKGQLFLDERNLWPGNKFATTEVVVRTAFYNQHPDLVTKFLQADVDTVQYIQSNPASASSIVNSEIARITGKGLTNAEILAAFNNLDLTYDPLADTVQVQSQRAYSLGFLKSQPDLSGMYQLGPLNQVLTSKGLAIVSKP